jgi:hypothetical protein
MQMTAAAPITLMAEETTASPEHEIQPAPDPTFDKEAANKTTTKQPFRGCFVLDREFAVLLLSITNFVVLLDCEFRSPPQHPPPPPPFPDSLSFTPGQFSRTA